MPRPSSSEHLSRFVFFVTYPIFLTVAHIVIDFVYIIHLFRLIMSGLLDALLHALSGSSSASGGESPSHSTPPRTSQSSPVFPYPPHPTPEVTATAKPHVDTPLPSSKTRSVHSVSTRSEIPLPPPPGLPPKTFTPSAQPIEVPPNVTSPLDLPPPVGDISMSSMSADISSTFSTPHELLLGPQPTPFIFRRRERRNSGETPSKVVFANASIGMEHRNESMPSMTALAQKHTLSQDESGDGDDEGDLQRMDLEVVIGGQKEMKLSKWRQEQLEKMNRPKVVSDGPPKPITTLHGPLSLPYARNPSGVDATIADDTAYLTHVFGLRADSKPDTFNAGTTTNRVSSNSTDGTRSTSGSSIFTNRQGKSDTSTSTVGTSHSVVLPAESGRPIVIRDPHQHIGIRKRGPVSEAGKDEHSSEKMDDLDSSPDNQIDHSPKTTTVSAPASLSNSTANRSLASLTMSAILSPSSILKAQLNQSGKSALPTIPGSPADEEGRVAFQPLFVRDVKAMDGQSKSRAIADDIAQYINKERDDSMAAVMYETPIRHNDADSCANTKERVPSGSKADASFNWRTRPTKGKVAAAVDTPEGQTSSSSPQLPQAPVKAKTANASPSSPDPVMTIDSLFEKFGVGSETGPAITVNPPTPPEAITRVTIPSLTPLGPSTKVNENLQISGPSDAHGTSIAADIRLDDVASIVSSQSNVSSADAEGHSRKSLPSGRASKATAKGTPGAGKLLKKNKRRRSSPVLSKLGMMPESPLHANTSDKENRPIGPQGASQQGSKRSKGTKATSKKG